MRLGDNFGNTFRVKDGKLTVSYDQYTDFAGESWHIFYKDKFSYYIVAVEYGFMATRLRRVLPGPRATAAS